MSAEYRQKLLNWFCSMALLLLICTLSLGITWRMVTLSMVYTGRTDLVDHAGSLSTGFMAYLIFFPAIAFWHLCDFLQASEPHQTGGIFTRYRGFAILLLLASPIAAISGAGGIWLTGDGGVFCYKPGDFNDLLYHPCVPASPFDIFMVIVVAPIVAYACLSKLSTTIASYRERADD